MRQLSITVLLAAALAAALSVSSCKSQRHSPPDYDPSAVTCICGQPEERFDGCHHPLCMRGEGNPENPDCVCGSLFDDEGGH